MRDIKTQKGFTIVETLIVLAVTGVMFASTVALISGQVAKAQYRDTVFRVNQAIQNTINDVQNGVFNPSATSSPEGCTSTGGKSTECVYAGIRVKIDNSGKMTKDYLYLKGISVTTGSSRVDDFNVVNSEETNLPSYVEYKPINPDSALTYYVLFNNYSYNSDSKGGAQSYKIKFAKPSELVVSNDSYLCLVNGSRKAKIVVGQNGQLESKIEFQPAGGC